MKDLLTTRKINQKKTRAEREEKILNCAFKEFSRRGIDNTAMTDIATKSGIGVASLYRYFKTKDEIAIRCIIKVWQKMKNIFTNEFSYDDFNNKSGLDQCIEVLSVFKKSYFDYAYFYIYVYEFDLYVRRHNIKPERLESYESVIKTVANTAIAAIQKGFDDKSIKLNLAQKVTAEELYISISSSLFFLVQKLAVSGNLLEMDAKISAERKIELVTDLFIDSIKA